MLSEQDKIKYVLGFNMNRDRSELIKLPLYYLKLGISMYSYLTINKETLYMKISEKELSDEFTFINKFTLNELDLILSSDNDLIKDRKLFILERV